MATHNITGKEGEQKAIDFLLASGYTILEKNYRYLKAEVDIIAEKDEVIIGVEVKTRAANFMVNPREAINTKKIQLLVSALDHYVAEKDIDKEVRFDIIFVINSNDSYTIEHIEDAFLFF